MLFLSHICYRCLWQMFSSCQEALACSLRSLRSSLCWSQQREVLHTPRSFQIFIQRFPAWQRLVQTSGSPQTKQPHPVIFESSLSFLGLRKHVRTHKRRNAGEVSISLRTRSTTDKDWHKFASLEEISSGLDHNKRLQSGIPLEILWLLSYPQDKNPLFVFVCPAL